MPLTPAQKTALKNDIIAATDQAMVDLEASPDNSDLAFAVAALYNLAASPAFTVWRTNIPVSDCKKATTWTEYIGRSQGERDAWQFILSNGIVNAADPNIRQGIQDIFSGPSGVTTRNALVAIAKRLATRVEKLLATGTGSDASPGTMGFEGNLSFQDVISAMAQG